MLTSLLWLANVSYVSKGGQLALAKFLCCVTASAKTTAIAPLGTQDIDANLASRQPCVHNHVDPQRPEIRHPADPTDLASVAT